MGAVACPYAETNSNTTANSTTWVDVTTIASGSFVAGHTYLLIAHGFVASNSTTNEARMRVVRGATPTVFQDASFAYDMVTANSYYNIGYMTVFTQPGGGAEDVKIQISNSSTSTTTATHGAILCLDLNDFGTQGTHWDFLETTTDYTTTTTFTNNGAVTISCNGTDNWLIVGSATCTPGDDTTQQFNRLNDSVAGAIRTISIEGEDVATEVLGHMLAVVYAPTNASHTFSIQHSHETGGTAGTIHRTGILALNLSHFSQVVMSNDATSDAPATSPTWTTTLGIDPTPDATDSFWVWGYAAYDVNAVSDAVNMRMQINASGGGLASTPNYGDDMFNATPRIDTTDIFPVNIFTKVTLNSGAAREINFDFTRTVGTAGTVIERCLFAARLNIAGGTTYNQSASGTLTTAGAIAKQTQTAKTATLTTAGALVKQAQKILAGTVTTAGALTTLRTAFATLAGTLTSSGALSKQAQKVITGTLTAAGAVVNQSQKVVTGTLTTAGALIKQTNKVLTGALTTAGALTAIKIALKVVDGTLAAAGALTKQTQRALDSTLTSAGTLIKETQRAFTATLTMAGALVKEPQKTLSGTLTSAGTLVRQAQKNITATLTNAGSLNKLVGKVLSGVLSFVGTLTSSGGQEDDSTGEPAILCHPMTLNLSLNPMAALAIDPMRYVYVAARPYTVNLTIAPMATVEIRPMKVRCC